MLFFVYANETPRANAQTKYQCSLAESDNGVVYGTDFRIVVTTPEEWDSEKFTLTITGNNFVGFPEREYEKNDPVGGNDAKFHVFEFKNDHEDDGDNMGKISHLPPARENGQMVAATYKIYAQTQSQVLQNSASQRLTSECEMEITILPPTNPEDTDSYPPFEDYDPIPANQIASGYKIEPLIINSEDNVTVGSYPIDGNTHAVKITFLGLKNETYRLCFQTDQNKCIYSDGFDVEEITPTNGSIVIVVCGQGSQAVKFPDESKASGGCDKEKDYFHENSLYFVGLYNKNFRSGPIAAANFYTYPAFPKVTLAGYMPKADGTKGGETIHEIVESDKSQLIEVTNPLLLTLSHIVKADGSEERNNYQVVLKSTTKSLTEGEGCINLLGTVGEEKSDSLPLDIGFLRKNSGPNALPVDEYELSIFEEVSEGSRNGTSQSDCSGQGGYKYYSIPLSIKIEGNQTRAYIDLAKVKKDPNGIITENIQNDLTFGSLPCGRGWVINEADGSRIEKDITPDNIMLLQECTEYQTALGPLGVSPTGFIKSLGRWLMGIAGIAAFGWIIYAGYIMLTSRGDQEKLGQAREIITAAVTGLTFIVLSVAILEIIGVDILKLPEFTRGDQEAESQISPTVTPTTPDDSPPDSPNRPGV